MDDFDFRPWFMNLRSPSVIRVREFSDPFGLFGLDVPPLSVELVVEGFARDDHGLQLLAVLHHDLLLVVELLTSLVLLKNIKIKIYIPVTLKSIKI